MLPERHLNGLRSFRREPTGKPHNNLSVNTENIKTESHSRSEDRSRHLRNGLILQTSPEGQMTLTAKLNQRPPNLSSPSMGNQKTPEAIRALIQIRHPEIRRHSAPVFRPPPPDGSMREQPFIAPLIARIEFFGRHSRRLKDDVCSVVEAPVAVNDSSLFFEL